MFVHLSVLNFRMDRYATREMCINIAKELKEKTGKQVYIWFQNKRQREKANH
ncbi:hypothetical protein BIW11_02980 [Tropilaelaps mercedesae]|uniref:Homeobox domain-containing protein n=1 Tax=Tropilaelaps mercedesae TaxID=418985 RepID=A0A1V9XTX7_9ACAR|nr:hypothetical protein BIW11_02980 [Tropilaelaps mercedesae]